MNKSAKIMYLLTLLNIALVTSVLSGTFTPKVWVTGDTLTAADLNALVTAVEAAVSDNNTKIIALQTDVGALRTDLTVAEDTISAQGIALTAANNDIAALDTNTNNLQSINPYVALVNGTTTHNSDTVQFSGVNVKIINGVNQTTTNGVGNLIVGYDTANTLSGVERCSDGAIANPDATTCPAGGGVWALSHKTGSHNLVVGVMNNYSNTSGVVFGLRNTSNRTYATVTGGSWGIASGRYSSVIGGDRNIASGPNSSVSGGIGNIATNSYSSVSGGSGNTASGNSSSVSGGQTNIASQSYSSVSGGNANTANIAWASVSGGRSNTANGQYSSVSGGRGCDTTVISYKWIVGDIASGCSTNSN